MPPAPALLPASVRHGYGVAAFSIAIANTSVMFFLLKFLVDGAGLNPALAGSVLLVGKVWDAVIDPLLGRWTDRTRTAWGVRRPWIIGATIPFALLFALLWQPIPLTGWARAAAAGLTLVLYSTAYSAITVPYGALTPVLATGYDERTRINTARMGWSMMGGIFAGILMPELIHSAGGWPLAGAVMGLCIPLPILLMAWATRGRDVAPAEPEAQAQAQAQDGLLDVLKVPGFRRVALLFVGAWSTIAVLSSLIPFYVEHHLHAPKMLDPLFAAIQISALLSLPLVGWLAGKLQKHRAYAVGMLAWAAVMIGLGLVPTGGATAALVLGVLAGPGVGAAHVLPWAMLPDVVAEDQQKHGRDRAGAFYGMLTFIEQAATALALQSVGIGLALAGYQEGAAQQPEQVQTAIRLLIAVFPAIILAGVAWAAWNHPPQEPPEAAQR